MDFKLSDDKKTMIAYLKGDIDAINATSLEFELLNRLDPVYDLTFDMTKLEYISSAGLRVLLSTQKLMKSKNGKMTIKHVNDDIMDTFKVTGFIKLFTII